MAETERIKHVSAKEFKQLLKDKRIRGASLNDVEGTHHKRTLYVHPNTGELYVEIPT